MSRENKLDPHSSEFIFRPLVKTKSSNEFIQKSKPISYTTFRDQLTKSLQNVVPDPFVYLTHPFGQVEPVRPPTAGLVMGFSRDMEDGRVLQLRMVIYSKDDISSRLLDPMRFLISERITFIFTKGAGYYFICH